MLVPLLLNLGGAPAAPVNASITVAFPVVYVRAMRPLWVNEGPTDTIVVTATRTPVGSYQ